MWSEAKAKVSHRLAMHLRVESLPAAQQHADGQLHLRRSAEERGHDRRRDARSARRARDVLCLGRPGWRRRARLGGRRCRGHGRAASQGPRDRLPHLLASARLRPRRSRDGHGNHAQPRLPSRARSFDHGSRILPIRSDTDPTPARTSSRRRSRPAAASCRASTAGSVDLQFLRAVPLIDREIDRDGIERAFDEAQTNNGWLIFYGHDVTDRPSPYGCSPALLERMRSQAASKRKIPALTMAEALQCARV